MRVWICVLLVVVLQPAFSQQQQSDDNDLRAKLAQKDVVIAQKDVVIATQAKEIVALNLELKMIEKAALGHDGEDAMNQAVQHLQQAQEALKKVQAAPVKKK